MPLFAFERGRRVHFWFSKKGHAVVRHVLDAGRRQLVEHLGMLRPHAVVALQQRVRALVVRLARAQEADEKRGVAATRRQRLVSDDALPQSVDVALTSILVLG